jgi:Zn finger protein HypA/HybF involved in hydrogenase expression
MATKAQKWIEAGKLIANNPKAKVLCPQCEENDLDVQDVKNEKNPSELERIMSCSNCGAKNVLRLKR